MATLIKEIAIYSGNRRAVCIEVVLNATENEGGYKVLRTQDFFFRTERGAQNFVNRLALAEVERPWDKESTFIVDDWWLGTKRNVTAHEILELSREVESPTEEHTDE